MREETAARVIAAHPDIVEFTSYSNTHRWAVDVARAVKRECEAPIVFGGPHVSAVPEPLLSDLDTLPQTHVAARIWGLQNYRSCLSRQNRISQASGAGGCKCR